MHYPDDVSDVTDPRGDLQWGTIPGLVEDAAARFGESEALVDVHGPGRTTTRLTFDGLAEQVAGATRAIVANGIERGDRVAIWAPNCAEWVVAALGAVGAGALLVPLNTRFKGAEAAYILRQSGARLLFTVQGFLGTDYPALLDEAVAAGRDGPRARAGGGPPHRRRRGRGPRRPRATPWSAWEVFLQEGGACSADVAAGRTASITAGDLSDLVFTSGTTGRPKGAMTTHGQTLRTFATWAEIVGLRKGDRYLIVNPFFHTFGYKAGILACLMTGATMVPEPVFDVDRVVERIEQERISVLPGPPTIFQSILDHPDRKTFELSSLRLVVTGAAVVPVELVRGPLVRPGHRDRPHRLRADRGHRDRDHVPSGRFGRGDRRDVGPGHPRRGRPDRRTRRGRGPEGRRRRGGGAGLQRHAGLLQRSRGLRRGRRHRRVAPHR